MPGFEDLQVWKREVELSAAIYRETRDLRDFGFPDQITRAVCQSARILRKEWSEA